jgi:hypothetical protein
MRLAGKVSASAAGLLLAATVVTFAVRSSDDASTRLFKYDDEAVRVMCHADSFLGSSGNLIGWTTASEPQGIGWSALVAQNSDGNFYVVKCKDKTITHL